MSVTAPALGTDGASATARTTTFSYLQDGTTTFPMKVGRPVRITDALSATTRLRYDSRGNLTKTIDSLNNTTDYAYDLSDAPTRTTLPATGQSGTGRGQIRTLYSYLGGPPTRTQIFDETTTLKRELTTQYGKEGEVLSSSGDQNAQSAQYDALYRQTHFRDGANNLTQFFYDADGRLFETRYPLANGTTGADIERITSFDLSDLPLQKTDGRGVTTNLGYESDGTLGSLSYPANPAENVSFGHDSLGRLTSRTDAAGVQTFAYNSVGTPNSSTTIYTRGDGSALPAWTQSATFNADGSAHTSTTPLGTLSYSYDGVGRLRSQSDWIGASSTWTYRSNGWLSSQVSPLGATTSFSHNALGQVIEHKLSGSALISGVGGTGGTAGQTLAQWGHPTDAAQKLLHNASGQLVRQSLLATAHHPTGGVTNYSYDTKGQIAGESSTRGLGHNHAFGFDGAGNPTSWRGYARSFNQNNQETTGGPLAFSYDGVGNATRWSGKRLVSTPSPTQGAPNIVSEEPNALAMSYSAQGQMAQVNELLADGSAGSLKQKNGYRGDGLRAWKEDAGGNRTYFFYAGTTLTGMVSEDASGTLSPPRQLLWGADGLLGLRWREANGDEKANYFLWDTQGNLALSYSEAGQLSRSFGFTAYGSPLPDANGEIAEATFGYGGKFGYLRDGETNLVLCTWRFYDPSLGTWTQRDPIGYAGGANLYGYVSGDPSNASDPLGLWKVAPSASPAPSVAKPSLLSRFGSSLATLSTSVFAFVLMDQSPAGHPQDTLSGYNAAVRKNAKNLIKQYGRPPRNPPTKPPRTTTDPRCPTPDDDYFPEWMDKAKRNNILGEIMKWGGGSNAYQQAINAIGYLDEHRLRSAGITADMARRWFELYDCQDRTNPYRKDPNSPKGWTGNLTAKGRRELMWYAWKLLQ